MKIAFFNKNQYLIIFFYFFFSLIGLLKYEGSIKALIFYDLALLAIALVSASKRAFFFDILISFYLTMGFFLKFNISTFMGGIYYDTLFLGPIKSTSASDMALIVSSVSFLAVLIAHSFFHFFFNRKSSNNLLNLDFTYIFYQKYRKIILFFLVVLISFANYTNYYFEIYTKGGINTYNFFIVNLYKYFIPIGFIFFILYLLQIELYKKNKFPWLYIGLIFFENTLSSISQISRAMIITSSSILLGIYKHSKINNLKLDLKFILLYSTIFFLLFSFSYYVVMDIRNEKFMNVKLNIQPSITQPSIIHSYENVYGERINLEKILSNHIKPMLIDRWVGIDGVIAVCSSSKLGWNLFLLSLKEKNTKGLSFYDSNFINSPYADTDFKKKQFVTLPGFIAYFFYPGSFLFLFFAILFLSLIGFFIELYSLYLTSFNYIIASFVSNLFVYRFINFGFMPLNTIQYIFIILMTLLFYYFFLNYLSNKLSKISFSRNRLWSD